jgi:hypothetical protein
MMTFPLPRTFGGSMLVALILAGSGLLLPSVHAQFLAEQMAVTEGMNTLNQGAVGGGGAGVEALNRAQGVAAGDPSAGAPPDLSAPPAPGQPIDFGALATGAAGNVPGLDQLLPRITVISGTRVFDAITGELLDDAVERLVPENQKENYFDDGTNGDVEPNDGKYTRVSEDRGYISQSNQRIKEELIQALISANDMNPLQFYGYTLMSTERIDNASRERAWKLVPNPDGPGNMLEEVPIDRPLVVPNYRDKEREKDGRVKDDWADRFLQDYRRNKDSLTSEFYSIYIPTPPVPPGARPPSGWVPFAATVPPEVLNSPRFQFPDRPGVNTQPTDLDEYAARGAGNTYYNPGNLN